MTTVPRGRDSTDSPGSPNPASNASQTHKRANTITDRHRRRGSASRDKDLPALPPPSAYTRQQPLPRPPRTPAEDPTPGSIGSPSARTRIPLAEHEKADSPHSPYAGPPRTDFSHTMAPTNSVDRQVDESPPAMPASVTTPSEEFPPPRRLGGWLSNMLSPSQQSNAAAVDDSASVRSMSSSPSKLPKSKSSHKTTAGPQIATSPTTSPSHQSAQPVRMSGLDRMLDRALQYFTDSDSTADKNPDDIWLLGLRHDGWMAPPQPMLTESERPREHLSGHIPRPSREYGDTPEGSAGNVDNLPKPSLGKFAKARQKLSRPGKAGKAARTSSSSSDSLPSLVSQDSLQYIETPDPSPSKWKTVNQRSAASASSNSPKNKQPVAQASSPPTLEVPPDAAMHLRQPGPAEVSRTSSRSSRSSQSPNDTSLTNKSDVNGHFARQPSLPTVYQSTQPSVNTYGWPESFYRDFYSRIQLTYRSGFAPIPCSPNANTSSSGTLGVFSSMVNNLNASIGRGQGQSQVTAQNRRDGLTNDTGWGCMLRTGQSLLANALMDVHLGRDWRRPLQVEVGGMAAKESIPDFSTYVRLVTWFLDDPRPTSPFSVHRFAEQGQSLGKNVGEWFGPSTAAGAIKNLANAFNPANLGVVTAIDTTVYRSEVFAVAGMSSKYPAPGSLSPNRSTEDFKRPVLILLPLRLGINGVNPIYYKSIKHFFTLKQCVGIAGGRPSSSYYFIGCQTNNLFYIDPHHTQATVPSIGIPEELQQVALASPLPDARPAKDSRRLRDFLATHYSSEDLASFHCEKVRKMSISGLDPSMLIGLLCKDLAEWEDLEKSMNEFVSSIPKGQGLKTAPIINIVNEMPAWMRVPSRSISGSNANTGALPTLASIGAASSAGETKSSRKEVIRAGTATTMDREEAAEDDSFDYADSDDWDIDDSDSNADQEETSPDRQSPSSSVVRLPASQSKEEETLDDWTDPREQSGTSLRSDDSDYRQSRVLRGGTVRVSPPQLARETAASSPPITVSNVDDADLDAVMIDGPQRSLSHSPDHKRALRPAHGRARRGTRRQQSVDSEDKRAGWEG